MSWFMSTNHLQWIHIKITWPYVPWSKDPAPLLGVRGGGHPHGSIINDHRPYCAWTKSCTTLTPWLKPLFVGFYRVIQSFQAFRTAVRNGFRPSTVGVRLFFWGGNRGFWLVKWLTRFTDASRLGTTGKIYLVRLPSVDITHAGYLSTTTMYGWLLAAKSSHYSGDHPFGVG